MPHFTAGTTILLHADDNLVVAARDLPAGMKLETGGAVLAREIPMGHKVATAAIRRGGAVRKFGQVIGFATANIEAGEWIHSHNLANGEAVTVFERAVVRPPVPELPAELRNRTFQGYRRADGRVGTRNYIAVISTVNCSATVCRYIAEKFDRSLLRDFPNVDGVVAFKHDTGCGMQFGGMKHEYLNRVLAGIAKHPNIGAFLLIGLGCEQGAMGHLLAEHQLVQIANVGQAFQPASANGHGAPPFVLSMQDVGGTMKTVEEGVRRLVEILPRVNDVRRVSVPASEIVLGTNCGGSDGQSGITANAALGITSDYLVAAGATSILAETPEIYGAEHLLTRRAKTPAVADKLLERIKWWKWYTGVFGADMDNNPSVGNKAGGLTTIAEKSLGAVAKAGSTAMNEVYEYAQPVTERGMVVMDTPGFDPPSVTGIVAGGANVVVFTTGRGSCFGCKPTPSIKVASNTPMYERMIDDMDIDAGRIVSAGASVEEVGREIFEKILAVASGEKTKSELHGLGDEEFVPWTPGPVL
jgi:altronate hydrolase